jgi:hypothetical protein
MNWIVQIGPNVSGTSDGYVNSTKANFMLSLGSGDPNETYAWYSTTSGNTWVPIPNNQQVQAAGTSMLLWRYSAPQGVSFKFLMAPA